jgi:polymerase delta-interacting protein 2
MNRNLKRTFSIVLSNSNNFNCRLAEVGVLETPREQGKAYETGQLFLHKIFGYRGIVLFPWLARVYDRDAASKTEERFLF